MHRDFEYWKQQLANKWEDYFYWDAKVNSDNTQYQNNSFRAQRKKAAQAARRYDGLIQKDLQNESGE